MTKISLEEVEGVLLQHKVTDAVSILSDLKRILEELEEEKDANAENKPKFEYVVVIDDPSGELKAQKKDEVITAYIVQQQEGEDAGMILSKLQECASLQNESAKRKKSRLESLRDIFSGLKSKFTKEKKIKIKTKEPVRILLA